MTTTQEATERELLIDQQAQRVTCKNCGALLLPDHGIIRASDDPPSGVTWWQCPNPDCGRRLKEDYELDLTDFRIITNNVTEV